MSTTITAGRLRRGEPDALAEITTAAVAAGGSVPELARLLGRPLRTVQYWAQIPAVRAVLAYHEARRSALARDSLAALVEEHGTAGAAEQLGVSRRTVQRRISAAKKTERS